MGEISDIDYSSLATMLDNLIRLAGVYELSLNTSKNSVISRLLAFTKNATLVIIISNQ